MKSVKSRTVTTQRPPKRSPAHHTAKTPLTGMDPKFVAAAKATKKRFAPLLKRLSKT